MSFVHAKTLDTRWGLGLARITLDSNDSEMISLSLWAPVYEDEELGEVTMDIALPLSGEVSDEAYDRWVYNLRKMMSNMDTSRFEAAFDTAGIGKVLDGVCGPIS